MSVLRGWVWVAVTITSLGSALAAEQPKAASAIDACVGASALDPGKHFAACAALLPKCARTIASTDAGYQPHLAFSVIDVADQCGPAYCPRLTPSPQWCLGVRGSPAARFAPEFELVQRALASEHDLRTPEAILAFLAPLRRLAEQDQLIRETDRLALHRKTRLVVELSLEGNQTLIRILGNDGAELNAWRGEAPTQEQFDGLVRISLKGAPVGPDENARIRAQKIVSFRVVKSVMRSLTAVGFGESLNFEAWQERSR